MATPKSRLVAEVVDAFRDSGNSDNAFDALAAKRLGVNETDLRCLNIIERSGGVTAGELAEVAGLTTGAVTGVVDRLERVGFATRIPDPRDRRRVKVEVTPAFYRRAAEIWGPMAEEWQATLSGRFTAQELERVAEFLRASTEIARRHIERLQAMD